MIYNYFGNTKTQEFCFSITFNTFLIVSSSVWNIHKHITMSVSRVLSYTNGKKDLRSLCVQFAPSIVTRDIS